MIAQGRPTDLRQMTETILNRSEYLDLPDRTLLRQVLGRGVLPREISLLTGLPTRTIQRRVRKLSQRLADPAVLYVLRHHSRWTDEQSRVALAIWVRRWTLRQTARELGLTLHQVRQHVAAVRALVDQGCRESSR